MTRSPLRAKSDRQILRDRIGALHFQILKLERGDNCEICGMPQAEGRFHIIPLSESLRLEFEDTNILLSHWFHGCQAHYKWHHYGKDDHRCDFVLRRIKELRGNDYRIELKKIELFKGKHDTLYLKAKLQEFTERLEALQKG